MIAAVRREEFPMEECVERIEAGVTRIETNVVRLDAKVSQLETSVGGVDTRVTKLEITVAQLVTGMVRLDTSVAHLSSDLAEFKVEIKGEVRSLRERVDGMCASIAAAKIWGLFIAAALLGVLARGFHWI
jgi:exonuclease VII small subunit